MEKFKEVLKKFRENIGIKLCVIILLSIVLTVICLYFSKVEYTKDMFFLYFKNKFIVLLNFLPILWLMILLFIISKRVSVAFILSTFLSFGLNLVNYFKISLRDDPLVMEDVTLIREAMNMQTKYSIKLDFRMILVIIASIILTCVLYFIFDRNKERVKSSRKNLIARAVGVVITVIVGVIEINTVYINNKINQKMSNTSMINIYSYTQQYISKGTIYSFLNSYSSMKKSPPEGYNKKEVATAMSNYKYTDIPDEKKVNVIGIMLEAYNDFSKFDEIEFEKDPYEKFHQLQKESYSGELVTDIFAGGTVDTERKFLTGYTYFPSNLRKKTNSYVYYFKEQGYTVEGVHPCYEWFYNRISINRNLGFQNYYFYEDTFKNYSDYIAGDNIVMPEILKMYRNHKENNSNPYFSFSVTYQNHGPYETSVNYSGINYIKAKEEYTQENLNIINNYLNGIKNTGEEVYKLTEELKKDDEPVILIVFGDHNPWLGNNNSVYEMLDINLDLSTDEGLYNYYCTPYIIWANDKAKEVLNNDFIGEGEKISPNFLMNKVFELAGYDGNEFMDASNELKSEFSVINSNFCVINDQIVRNLSDDENYKLNEFNKKVYYWINNFKER